ncbi:MAG: hypothetical protein ACRDAI_04750 [Candidatus Rhabdochlamydia sp.]
MSYPNGLQRMADPMSPYNMSLQSFQEEQKRISKRESDRINERYYKSISSSSKESKRDKTLAQDTPVSLALEKKLAERDKQDYLLITGSSSSNFMNLIKSWLPWR